MSLQKLKKDLQKNSNPEKAKILQRFFKTGKGQYGEGDIFLGIVVPKQREISKKYDLNLKDLNKLLDSKIHEHRLCALFILIKKYKKSNEKTKKEIFNFYIGNSKRINNWDLVDLSAPNIAGDYIFHNKKEIKKLYSFSKSKNLWEKRISIISLFYFIREKQFDDTFAISEILLNDSHDLIHKAVGWMLREIGKRDLKVLEDFLKKHYKDMPRTMLRYSIEKFDEGKRQKYLKGEI